MKLWPSPMATAWPTPRIRLSLASSICGATYLPPLVLKRSFLRSVMCRNPSSSKLADVTGVQPALLVDQLGCQFWAVEVPGVMLGPLPRISPSSAIRSSTHEMGLPTVPDRGSP